MASAANEINSSVEKGAKTYNEFRMELDSIVAALRRQHESMLELKERRLEVNSSCIFCI